MTLTLQMVNPNRMRSTDGRVEIWLCGSSSGPDYRIDLDGRAVGPSVMDGMPGCDSYEDGMAWLEQCFGRVSFLDDAPWWWQPQPERFKKIGRYAVIDGSRGLLLVPSILW